MWPGAISSVGHSPNMPNVEMNYLEELSRHPTGIASKKYLVRLVHFRLYSLLLKTHL